MRCEIKYRIIIKI